MTAPPANETALGQEVLRKVTWRIVPLIGLLFIVNHVDRTNIGFAKLSMSTDLGLSDTAYGLASGLFFIGYMLLEVPSNLALHRFGARKWIARIILTWGLVAMGMAFVPNASSLYLLRVLLGVAEAGFFPGIILYLTFWFPRRHRAAVTGLFLLANPLATIIGAPLAAFLMEFGTNTVGVAGWRFMFFAQGIPAVLLSVVVWFYMTDRPANATWLSTAQKQWLVSEMDGEQATIASEHKVSMRKALLSWQTLRLSLVYFGCSYGAFALAFFLPSIIAGFQKTFGVKYSLIHIGLLTAVPYVAAAIAMVLWSRHASRTREHVWHTAIPLAVGGVAIPIAIYAANPLLAMVAISFCAVGALSAMAVFWSLPTALMSGSAAAAGIAMVNVLGGALGGFASPYIMGALNDLTGSSNAGLWVVGGVMICSALTALTFRRSATAAATAAPNPSAATSEPLTSH
jgi:MFS family permease